MKILHLSDIHFGRNHTELKYREPMEKHDEILNGLIDTIVSINQEQSIDHIIVTGDIAWYGKKKEYNEALIWFNKLLGAIGKTGKDVSFCVGNHDVNRTSAVPIDLRDYYIFKDAKPREPIINKIDELYEYENISKIQPSIQNFFEFCEELGVVPFQYPGENGLDFSYAVGYKDIELYGECIRLLAFDTAVFSFTSEVNEDKMWLGASQINTLMEYEILTEKEDYLYRIALFHHAERFLDPNELCEYNGRKATYDTLLNNVDLALCGHTETGGQPYFYTKRGAGMILTGGATYYNDEHPNSFSIIYAFSNKGKKEFLSDSYYYKNGWKRYGDKKETRGISNLKEEEIVNIRENASFELAYDDKKYSIEAKRVAIQKKDDKYIISNKAHVNRYLDIQVEARQTVNQQTLFFSINLAKGMERSVQANIERDNYYQFILSNYSEAENRYIGLFIDNQEILSSREPGNYKNIEVNIEKMNILKRVRRLEEYYDVIFSIPDKDELFYCLNRIRVLEDIMREGQTRAFQFKDILCASFNSKEKMKLLYKKIKRKNAIQLYYEGDFIAEFWGATIKLGHMYFYTEPYKVASKRDLRQKVRTYRDGDSREIKFKSLNDSTIVLSKYDIKDTSFIKEYLVGLPSIETKGESEYYKFDFIKEIANTKKSM